MPYDAVYPLGSGSKWNNNELRYSLRSLEKNLVDLRNVYIVGYRPEWLTGAIHIPCDDPLPHNKDGNIIRKILRACQTPGLSEDFLQVSDDQILLRPLSFAELYPYYVVDLAGVDESWFSRGAWGKRMERTYQWLRARWPYDLSLRLAHPAADEQVAVCSRDVGVRLRGGNRLRHQHPVLQ